MAATFPQLRKRCPSDAHDNSNQPRRDDRIARDRSHAGSRRALLHANSRRPRRRRDQGRTAGRRRSARLGTSVPRRRCGLFRRHQPQQALDRARPRFRGRARRADADAGARRRPDREFQAGHARQMGHRQRRAARKISKAGALPDFRFRRRRPARRQSGL